MVLQASIQAYHHTQDHQNKHCRHTHIRTHSLILNLPTRAQQQSEYVHVFDFELHFVKGERNFDPE